MYSNGEHYTLVTLPMLFTDRNWDIDRERKLDEKVRIYPQRFFKRRWIYCNTWKKDKWRTKCNMVAKLLTYFLMQKMMDEMMNNQHKLIVNVIKQSGVVSGTIHFGAYERRMMDSVRSKTEFRSFIASKTKAHAFRLFEPIIRSMPFYNRILYNKVKNGHRYESIDVQKRTYAYLGLNKARRRSRRRTEA